MTVAKDIFHFLNNHFIMCNSSFVTEYVQKSLSEIDVIVLAALIRDLDRETGKYIFSLIQFTRVVVLVHLINSLVFSNGIFLLVHLFYFLDFL